MKDPRRLMVVGNEENGISEIDGRGYFDVYDLPGKRKDGCLVARRRPVGMIVENQETQEAVWIPSVDFSREMNPNEGGHGMSPVYMAKCESLNKAVAEVKRQTGLDFLEGDDEEVYDEYNRFMA